MGIRRRQADEDQRTGEARARAQRLSTSDLYEWAENCQFVYGKALHEHRGNADPNFVEEAVFAAEVQLVIAREIRSRIK